MEFEFIRHDRLSPDLQSQIESSLAYRIMSISPVDSGLTMKTAVELSNLLRKGW